MTNSANSQSIQQPLPDKVLPFAKIRECNNNSPTTRLILAQPLNGLEVCGFSVWSGENKPTAATKSSGLSDKHSDKLPVTDVKHQEYVEGVQHKVDLANTGRLNGKAAAQAYNDLLELHHQQQPAKLGVAQALAPYK